MHEELNEKEKLILKNLVNPDNPKDRQYTWPLEVQQQVLACLISDKSFLDQCYHLVKPYYFTDKAHQRICNILYKYYTAYRQLPNKPIIEAELTEQLEDNPAFAYYMGELDVICDHVNQGLFQRDYFLEKTVEFAKSQAIRVAFAEVIDILSQKQENKWQKIEDVIRGALSINVNVDLGSCYFEELEKRYERMLKQQEEQDFFTTGFRSIDIMLGGGLSRGEIGAFCGNSGSGKSIMMASASADNLSRGRKLLYLSLEMDEDKTSCRFDSMLTGIPFQLLLQDKDTVIASLNDFLKTLPDGSKNNFYVKQFPAGTADMGTIRAYLAQLSLQRGFTPDMMIVDYVGEMKDEPGIKTYESRQKLVRDLRGLAVENKICILTGMQIRRGGREAMKSGYIDEDYLADSQGQIRPLDALWSINMEDTEAAQGVGRIFVVKHRNGKSRQLIYFQRDEKTLKIDEISVDKYKKICSEHINSVAQSGDIINDLATESAKWEPSPQNKYINYDTGE